VNGQVVSTDTASGADENCSAEISQDRSRATGRTSARGDPVGELLDNLSASPSTPDMQGRLAVHPAGRGVWAVGEWKPAGWALGLGVFRHGEALGMVTLRARDFPVIREVTTSSWLGIDHHGQGYGTEARTGLLTLAFDHLGARAARTEVFQDNDASQGVSRKLGYERDGISVDARGDEAVVSDRLRLTRDKWAQG
jgi:RimJ/RimL family protein N-acetyltransferase